MKLLCMLPRETYPSTDTCSVFPFLPRSPSAGGCTSEAGVLSGGRNKRVRSGWQMCSSCQLDSPVRLQQQWSFAHNNHFGSFQLCLKKTPKNLQQNTKDHTQKSPRQNNKKPTTKPAPHHSIFCFLFNLVGYCLVGLFHYIFYPSSYKAPSGQSN